MHQSHISAHRVLLLDSRRDGLSARVEDGIVTALRRAGLAIDLDAISDPRSIVRILRLSPNALTGYDAVVAIAPLHADLAGSTKALTEVLRLVREQVPTMLVTHRAPILATAKRHGVLPPADDCPAPTLLLPDPLDPVHTARTISAALAAMLTQPAGDPDRSGLEDAPAPAAQLRQDIGALAVSRLEQIVQLTRDQFGLHAAEVSLRHHEVIVTIASAGASLRAMSATESLFTLAMRNTDITVLPDTWLDAEACRRAPTRGPRPVRFYAGCPIRSHDGEPIGVLCIWDHNPRTPHDLDLALLHDLALLTEGELLQQSPPQTYQ